MKNRKIIIDREKITKQEIKERSNFNNILSELNHSQNLYFKTTSYWGVTGLASILFAILSPLVVADFKSKKKNAVNSKTNQQYLKYAGNTSETADKKNHLTEIPYTAFPTISDEPKK